MLHFQFTPFPTLETGRLNLRKITLDDLEDVFLLRTDIESMKHIGKRIPTEKKEIEDLINHMENELHKNAGIAWGISLKDEPSIIGSIGFHRSNPEHHRAEIGYMLRSAYWGQGLMSEAIREVLKYGFEVMNLHSIEANVDPTNQKSIGILTKFGFVKEAYFRQNFYFNGKFLDSAIYSLLEPASR